MRHPPLYTMRDLETWVTISHVLDADEIMTLERAVAEKHQREMEARQR